MRFIRKYFLQNLPDLPILNKPSKNDHLDPIFGFATEIQFVVRALRVEECLAEMEIGSTAGKDFMVGSEPRI